MQPRGSRHQGPLGRALQRLVAAMVCLIAIVPFAALAAAPPVDSIIVSLPALYAEEKAGGRITRIGPDGAVTTSGNSATVGGLNGPDNIAFGPDGYLYVGEKYGGRIVRIAFDGTHTVYASGFENVEGVVFDPLTGYLYIGEIEKSTLWRVPR